MEVYAGGSLASIIAFVFIAGCLGEGLKIFGEMDWLERWHGLSIILGLSLLCPPIAIVWLCLMSMLFGSVTPHLGEGTGVYAFLLAGPWIISYVRRRRRPDPRPQVAPPAWDVQQYEQEREARERRLGF